MNLKLEQGTVRCAIQTLAESLSKEARALLIDAELNDPRPNALILLNGKEINVLKGLETEVKEGDEVTLIPVSHGG
jgi:molybdopterin converting factor small subunit